MSAEPNSNGCRRGISAAYDDSGVNWRVVEGYGTTIAAHGADLPVVLGCAVRRIDRSGRRLRVETAAGSIAADAGDRDAPQRIAGGRESRLHPGPAAKTEAAAGLPLGLPTSCSCRSPMPGNSRRTAACSAAPTAAERQRITSGHSAGRRSKHYFAATLAAELETAGEDAFLDSPWPNWSACSAATSPAGSSRFTCIVGASTRSRAVRTPSPFRARRIAVPRSAAPVDDRLFFAGEACSTHDYSTAHGAYLTGVAAADQAIAARRGKTSR